MRQPCARLLATSEPVFDAEFIFSNQNGKRIDKIGMWFVGWKDVAAI